MPDNGYGTKANSADFLLRLNRIRPDFTTASGGSSIFTDEFGARLRSDLERNDTA
jgi:hypothetical protein